MAHSGTLAEVLARTAVGYPRANERLGLFEGRYATPKTVWNSTAMSYLGIAGCIPLYRGGQCEWVDSGSLFFCNRHA